MMKLEIKEKKENKILNRLEISGRLVFEKATPSNQALQEVLAVELKTNKDLIVIKHIYPKFSFREASFLAYIYFDKKTMQKMEVSTKHLRKKAEEEKKKAAEAAAQKAEENATEEVA